jgi:DNA-binding XRE family transcriptional regulator
LRDSWWRQPASFDTISLSKRKEVQNMLAVILLGLLVVMPCCALFIYIVVLLIKALRRYLKSADVRKEKAETKKTLGEILKTCRTDCKMTQEFVAESLGVSRQAVSKWENGTSDPSTSNLLALAKLYGVSVEEILNKVN